MTVNARTFEAASNTYQSSSRSSQTHIIRRTRAPTSAVDRLHQLHQHLNQQPYSTAPAARKKRASAAAAGQVHSQRPFIGHFSCTGHALALIQACIDDLLSFRTTRLGESERPVSGTVYIFERGQSGIKRWTDGMTWSPTRLSDECMVYREVCTTLPEDFVHVEDRPDSQEYQKRIKPVVASLFEGSKVTLKKPSGNIEVFIDPHPDCLIKRTFTCETPNREYHVVGYISLRDWLSGRFLTPFEHPLIGPLIQNIDQHLLQRSCYKRCWPRILPDPVTGLLYYAGEGGTDTDSSSVMVVPQPHITYNPPAHASVSTYTPASQTWSQPTWGYTAPQIVNYAPIFVSQNAPLTINTGGYLYPSSTSSFSGLDDYRQEYAGDSEADITSKSTPYYPYHAQGVEPAASLATTMASCSIDSPASASDHSLSEHATSASTPSFMSSPFSYMSTPSYDNNTPSPYALPSALSADHHHDNGGYYYTLPPPTYPKPTVVTDYSATIGISPTLISPTLNPSHLHTGTTYFPVVKTEYEGFEYAKL